MASAGKSATGVKRGKIRVRLVTTGVEFDWLGESANLTLANTIVPMEPIKNHPGWNEVLI